MKHKVAGIIGIIITAILLVLYLPPLVLYGILDIGNAIGFVVAALVLIFSIQQLIKASDGAAKRNYDRSQAGGTRGKLHRQFNHDMGRNTVLIERGGLGNFTADRSIGYDGDRESHAGTVFWIIIFALIICFYAQGLVRMLSVKQAYFQTDTQSEDNVIVLGCGVRGEKPTRMLRQRIEAARVYLMENPDSIAVVTGGQGNGEDISEAECMRRYLTEQQYADDDPDLMFMQACRDHGIRGRDYNMILSEYGAKHPVIDENRVIMEDKATDTSENIKYSRSLLVQQARDENRLILVTQGYHEYRAISEAKSQGATDVSAFPASIDWWNAATYMTRECASLLYHTLL